MGVRLPVYLLIDTSGSMRGEPIESVKVAIESWINALRSNPYALETVSISIITFDRVVRQLLPLTPLEEMRMPEIEPPKSGPSFTGRALNTFCTIIDKELRASTVVDHGDFKPILFLITDGKPSDRQEYNEAIARIHSRKFTNIVACTAGPKSETEYLKKLTDNVYKIDDMDGLAFLHSFTWLMGEGSQSTHTEEDTDLPAPPAEIDIVL